MNAIAHGLKKAGRQFLATPAAVFVAVLTAGMATASVARHAGLCLPHAGNTAQKNVVLACTRTKTNAQRPTANGTKAPSPASRQKTAAAAPNSPANSPATTAENTSLSPEKQQTGKTGSSSGTSFSVPLPDFNAPELSRFISPL